MTLPVAHFLCAPLPRPSDPGLSLVAFHIDGVTVRFRLFDGARELSTTTFTDPVAIAAPGAAMPLRGYPVPWKVQHGQRVVAEVAASNSERTGVRAVSVDIDDGRSALRLGVKDLAKPPRESRTGRVIVDLEGGTLAASDYTRLRADRVDFIDGTIALDERWIGAMPGQTLTAERVHFAGTGRDSQAPFAPAATAHLRDCEVSGTTNGPRGAQSVLGVRVRDILSDAFSDNLCVVGCTIDGIDGRGTGLHGDVIQHFSAQPGHRRDNVLAYAVSARNILAQTLMIDQVEFGSAAFVDIASDSDTAAGNGGRLSHIMSRFDHLLIDGLHMPLSRLAFRMAPGEQGRVVVRNSTLLGIGAGRTRDGQPGEFRDDWTKNCTILGGFN